MSELKLSLSAASCNAKPPVTLSAVLPSLCMLEIVDNVGPSGVLRLRRHG